MEPHLHVFLAVPRDCDTVNDEDILRYIFEDVWDHGALFCDVCFVILLSHGKHVSTHMFHAPSFDRGKRWLDLSIRRNFKHDKDSSTR